MKQILIKLLDYQYLSREEAKNLLFSIVKGEIPDTQIASIITTFLMRSISVEEVLGFRDALMETQVHVDLSDYRPIDVVGTGGDGKNSFNISTAACFVIAGAGYNVVKHGNYGSTSVSGASNVIEYLGVKFTTDNSLLRRSLDACNMAYLHAPLFSPALKAVAQVRKSLGVRTFFNVLGPLVNPANPEYRLLGVYDLSMARLYSYIYQEEKRNFTIVHSIDGYDEISLTDTFKVLTNKGEKLFEPSEIGFNKVDQKALQGGHSIEDSAAILKKILYGEATPAQTNVVVANAAFAIRTIEPDRSIEECIVIAQAALLEKKAADMFEKFIELNS